MSIIYEALKKIDDSALRINEEGPVTKESQKKTKKRVFFMYALAACLGLISVNLFFYYLSQPKKNILPAIPIEKTSLQPHGTIQLSPQPQAPPTPLAPTPNQPPISEDLSLVNKQPERQFYLNGVFSSENEWFALVNNQIVQVGDNVNGAQVKEIGMDGVILEAEGSTIKLSSKK